MRHNSSALLRSRGLIRLRSQPPTRATSVGDRHAVNVTRWPRGVHGLAHQGRSAQKSTGGTTRLTVWL